MTYPAPRWDAVFRLALVGFGHGSTPGWADVVVACGLPVRDVEVGWAFPRECGEVGTGGIPGSHRGLGRCAPSAPAFWAAVTPMRPGGPASHHRRGHSWVDWEGCDHADGTPAACLVAGAQTAIALPEGARLRHCAQRVAAPVGGSSTMTYPAPRWGEVFRLPLSAPVADPHQVGRALWGGLPACPSEMLKWVGLCPRECGEVGTGGIAGCHRGLGRCAPSAPAFWAAVTPMIPGGPASPHRRGRS